ncbi:hypothetical protein [Marinobacterium lutimaris]|uniref:General secretion pathway protein N n=1 Tax=Marinobacterium lutimaris TaxID=568106 RepID=A0A1H5WZ10_9GAMM|nr:hypothetical protein [Marinobacterium lutimaris]SEG04752.1 hypothetical protein SAMN05444390_1011213 [Marinobacterium lutimaris]
MNCKPMQQCPFFLAAFILAWNSMTLADETSENLQLPELPPRASFDETLERPLFSETRRPERMVDEGEAVSARELRDNWRLTGIIMVGGEDHAMLQERKGDKHRILSTGMPLDSTWQLDAITPDTVVMKSGEEEVRLNLREPRDTRALDNPASAAGEGFDNGDAQPLEERAREAIDRLQLRIQTTRDQQNE